jgi:FtsZ-binding cell division protein ZapB
MAQEAMQQQITTMDLNNMSSEELKSYSDSLQASDSSLTSAADVIADESVEPVEKPDENSGLSLLDLRAKAKSLA